MVEAVRHCRAVMGAIRQLQTLDDDEIYVYAKVHPCHMPNGPLKLLRGAANTLWALPGVWPAQAPGQQGVYNKHRLVRSLTHSNVVVLHSYRSVSNAAED